MRYEFEFETDLKINPTPSLRFRFGFVLGRGGGGGGGLPTSSVPQTIHHKQSIFKNNPCSYQTPQLPQIT